MMTAPFASAARVVAERNAIIDRLDDAIRAQRGNVVVETRRYVTRAPMKPYRRIKAAPPAANKTIAAVTAETCATGEPSTVGGVADTDGDADEPPPPDILFEALSRLDSRSPVGGIARRQLLKRYGKFVLLNGGAT